LDDQQPSDHQKHPNGTAICDVFDRKPQEPKVVEQQGYDHLTGNDANDQICGAYPGNFALNLGKEDAAFLAGIHAYLLDG